MTGPSQKTGGPAAPLALALMAFSAALFAFNHVAWRGGELAEIEGSRRLWEDFAVAQTQFHAAPDDPRTPIDGAGKVGAKLRRFAPEWVQKEGIKPWEFWRTVRVPVRFRVPALALRETDDHGRSQLLRLAFHVLGGVAPMMVLWVGPLVGLPVLLWLVLELVNAGRGVAAALVACGLASSPFLVLALSLPYAPMGFYLVGVLLLMTVSVAAFLNPSSRLWPFLLRVALAGLAFALLLRCRSSMVFLAPAFVLAVSAGVWKRTESLGARARGGVVAVSLALLLGPWLLSRSEGHHEVFLGLWEGLGDFDQTKGHYWNDAKAKDFLEMKGRPIPRDRPIWLYNNEDLFKQAVVEDILGDPLWYSAILVKRAVSAAALTRLWTDRLTALEPSETTIRVYWNMAPPVHRLRFGEAVVSLWPPVLIGLTLLAAGLRRSSDGALLGIGFIGTLLLPVAFTTAAGVEVQGIGLVYLMGSALAADTLVRRFRPTAR